MVHKNLLEKFDFFT